MSRTRLAKAPYNRDGDLMDYVDSYPDRVHEWRRNRAFRALLVLHDSERGMSAARFVWHNSEGGHIYKMFMTDMTDLVKNAPNIYKGTVDTWWIAQKRGKNYGIRLAAQDDFKADGHTGGARDTCRACDGTNPAYNNLCPLRPNPAKAHAYEADLNAPGIPGRAWTCRCGLAHDHPLHTGGLDGCSCSKESSTACSNPLCQG
ncbi:hypothetical protein [Streptomyces sp. NPDC059761]|uniref:hypothetical protein n=1 Tax=Streptomyces sp. NPDC059761 TaxID=3346937 RepID=UPI003668A3A4